MYAKSYRAAWSQVCLGTRCAPKTPKHPCGWKAGPTGWVVIFEPLSGGPAQSSSFREAKAMCTRLGALRQAARWTRCVPSFWKHVENLCTFCRSTSTWRHPSRRKLRKTHHNAERHDSLADSLLDNNNRGETRWSVT